MNLLSTLGFSLVHFHADNNRGVHLPLCLPAAEAPRTFENCLGMCAAKVALLIGRMQSTSAQSDPHEPILKKFLGKIRLVFVTSA